MTASGSVSVPRSPAQGRVVNSKEEITIAAAEDGLARLETAAADLPHGHRHAEDRRLERHGQVSPIIAANPGQLLILAAAIDRGRG
jgi:hypothetical protein